MQPCDAGDALLHVGTAIVHAVPSVLPSIAPPPTQPGGRRKSLTQRMLDKQIQPMLAHVKPLAITLKPRFAAHTPLDVAADVHDPVMEAVEFHYEQNCQSHTNSRKRKMEETQATTTSANGEVHQQPRKRNKTKGKKSKRSEASHDVRFSHSSSDAIRTHLQVTQASIDSFVSALKQDMDSVPFTADTRGHQAVSTWSQVGRQFSLLQKKQALHQLGKERLERVLEVVLAKLTSRKEQSIIAPYVLPSTRDLEEFRVHLEALYLVACIMSNPELDEQLRDQDSVHRWVDCLRHLVHNEIFPSFDAAYRPANTVKGGISSDEYWAQITSLLNGPVHRLCAVFTGIEGYFRRGPALDTLCEPVIAACLSILSMEATDSLQLAAADLLCTVCIHNAHVRSDVVERLAEIWSEVEPGGRKSKGYRLGSGKFIRIPLACLLHLVQCVTLGSEHRSQSMLEQFTTQPEGRQAKVFSSLVLEAVHDAENLVELFVKAFLTKLSRQDKKMTRKSAMGCLVANLLLVVFHPEWPAAELVLNSLCLALAVFVQSANKDKHVNAARAACIDSIGDVCARMKEVLVQASALRVGIHTPTTEFDPKGDPTSAAENAQCVCNATNPFNELFMLDCDDCHSWFHGRCVNMPEADMPEKWYCVLCRLRRELDERKERQRQLMSREGLSPSKKRAAPRDESELVVDCCRQIVLHGLNGAACKESRGIHFTSSRQFALAFWLADGHRQRQAEQTANHESEGDHHHKWLTDEDADLFFREWHLVRSLLPEEVAVDEQQCMEFNVYLARDRGFLQSFDRVLNVILRSLSEKQPTFRSKAVKALGAIIQKDTALFGDDRVRKAVNERLQDLAISVREAAMDLIGKYILCQPQFVEKYFDMLSRRIRDSGLSVRKRVIKIFRDVVTFHANSSRYVDICALMLERVDDEEGVSKLVTQTFQQLWFSESPVMSSRCVARDAAGVAVDFSDAFSCLVDKIVSVVGRMADPEWLVSLVGHMLNDGKASRAKLNLVRTLCEDMAACAVQKLIAMECREDVDESKQFQSLEPIVKLLDVLCTARPAFLVGSVSYLQPHLKLDLKHFPAYSAQEKGSAMSVISRVAHIMLMALPLVETPPALLVGHLESDLKTLVKSVPLVCSFSEVLSSVVPCLCMVARLLHKRDSVEWLLKSFYLFLVRYRQRIGQAAVRKTIVRGLFTVGLLIKHFDFDSLSDADLLTGGEGGEGEQSSITHAVYITYTDYCTCGDALFERFAFQGLMFLFSRRMDLMLQSTELIQKGLAFDNDVHVLLQVLRGIHCLLQTEEARFKFLQDKDTDKRKKDRQSARVRAAEEDEGQNSTTGAYAEAASVREGDDSDAGVVAGVMQTCLDDVLQLCLHREAAIRLQSLELLRVFLDQGIVAPVLCVTHIVSLLADSHAPVRDKAFQQFLVLHDRHASFLRSRLLKGIALSFKLVKHTAGDAFSALDEQCCGEAASSLARVYHVFKDTKGGRSEFVSQLVPFITDLKTATKQVGEADAVAFLAYMARVASRLSLDHDEPIRLVHTINRRLVQAGMLESSLESKLEEMTVDDDGSELNNTTKELVQSYADLCRQASAASVMLLLKAHLRAHFSVSEDQARQWTNKCKLMCTRRPHTPALDLSSVPPCPLLEYQNEHFNDCSVLDSGVPDTLRRQHEFFSDLFQRAADATVRASDRFPSSDPSDNDNEADADAENGHSAQKPVKTKTKSKRKTKSKPKPRQTRKSKRRRRKHDDSDDSDFVV